LINFLRAPMYVCIIILYNMNIEYSIVPILFGILIKIYSFFFVH